MSGKHKKKEKKEIIRTLNRRQMKTHNNEQTEERKVDKKAMQWRHLVCLLFLVSLTNTNQTEMF